VLTKNAATVIATSVSIDDTTTSQTAAQQRTIDLLAEYLRHVDVELPRHQTIDVILVWSFVVSTHDGDREEDDVQGTMAETHRVVRAPRALV